MMKHEVILGAHMSARGGVHTAFARGSSIGCSTMQVFVKNANRWFARPLSDEDIQSYKREEVKARISPVVAHASYLINLCAVDPALLMRSLQAFEDELRRCEALGIPALVFHPGSHMGRGEAEGIKRVAESLNIVHQRTQSFHVLTTLECTAGQGSALGYRFEHLRDIVDQVDDQARMAVCLDTCHLFAAGYHIETEKGWQQTMKQFGDIVGFARLVAVHVNDSKRECGSCVDRHERIGRGRIGTTGFRMLMNDPRLRNIPKILETEKSEDMHEDVENMNLLRSLIEKNR